MRKKQAMEKASLSFESSDQDQRVMTSDLMDMYNRDYSLIYNQARAFFADCKDFLTRFMMLNNMGIGFNLPMLLSSFMAADARISTPGPYGTCTNRSATKKQAFEKKFKEIVTKMGLLIEEMLVLETEIKRQYLGQAFSTPEPTRNAQSEKTHQAGPKYKLESVRKKLYANQKRRQLETRASLRQNSQQENALRSILHKSMNPIGADQKTVCSMQLQPALNLQKVTNKIDSFLGQVKSAKEKQQKIWKIFDQKRPSRAMLEQSAADNNQQEYHQLRDMFSDIVSQRSRAFYKQPSSTLENSLA